MLLMQSNTLSGKKHVEQHPYNVYFASWNLEEMCFRETLFSPFSLPTWNNKIINVIYKHLLRKLEEDLILERQRPKLTYSPQNSFFCVLILFVRIYVHFLVLKAEFSAPQVTRICWETSRHKIFMEFLKGTWSKVNTQPWRQEACLR